MKGRAVPQRMREYTVQMDAIEAACIERLAREYGLTPDELIARLAREGLEELSRKATGTDRPSNARRRLS